MTFAATTSSACSPKPLPWQPGVYLAKPDAEFQVEAPSARLRVSVASPR